MSAETFEYHYGKHLQTYIDNLNKLIEGTPYAEMPLDEIVRKADEASSTTPRRLGTIPSSSSR